MADRSGTPPGTLQYSECRPWAVVESFSVPLGVWRPPLHLRHCVELHWRRHCGTLLLCSNVFHSVPHVQKHLSSLLGDQPQSGQRIRGGSAPGFFSSSSSRSGAIVGASVVGLIFSAH
jgi:hypothetical protein